MSKLLKKHKEQLSGFYESKISIGVISDCTFDLISPSIVVYAASKKIELEVVVSDYGLEMTYLLGENSFSNLDLDFILVSFTHRVVKKIPITLEEYINELNLLNRNKVIVQTIPYPVDLSVSSRDITAFNSFVLNSSLNTVVDVEKLSNFVGIENWHDESKYFMAKTPFSMNQVPRYSKLVVKRIMDLLGYEKKCLILDLDNTLWGGVIGDDGLDGIRIGEGSVLGEAFLSFQMLIKELSSTGIILAVCSKNEINNALLPFQEHKDMILKKDDITIFKANWKDKASNIVEIASELNLGLSSFVFVDDNPAEREVVKKRLPMVDVIDLPSDPALYSRVLLNSFSFDLNKKITEVDQKKSELYKIKQSSESIISSFSSYSEYLVNLEMYSSVEYVNENSISRFSQILGKTNQFNMTGKRYSVGELEYLSKDERYILICFRLKDRFGDHGIVSAVVLKVEKEVLEIENWVMSCRVFKRDLEKFIFNACLDIAYEKHLRCIGGYFYPNSKNKYVSDLYESLGMRKLKNEYWRINLEKAQKCIVPIGVKSE